MSGPAAPVRLARCRRRQCPAGRDGALPGPGLLTPSQPKIYLDDSLVPFRLSQTFLAQISFCILLPVIASIGYLYLSWDPGLGYPRLSQIFSWKKDHDIHVYSTVRYLLSTGFVHGSSLSCSSIISGCLPNCSAGGSTALQAVNQDLFSPLHSCRFQHSPQALLSNGRISIAKNLPCTHCLCCPSGSGSCLLHHSDH